MTKRVRQSAKTNSLIPNRALFFGLYCLKERRPLNARRVSSMHKYSPGCIALLKFFNIFARKVPNFTKRSLFVWGTVSLFTKCMLLEISWNLQEIIIIIIFVIYTLLNIIHFVYIFSS